MGKAAELAGYLKGMEGRRHAILSQDGPDPDVLGSGEAMRMILLNRGISDADLLYTGRVTHPQNRAMVKLLDIGLANYGDVDVDFGSYDGFWFLDTQGATVEAYRDGRVPREKILGAIDHHTPPGEEPFPYMDIRTEVGATSSIMAEYLRELELLKKDDPQSRRVATALVLGILTDTKKFRNASRTDFEAHEFLQPYLDTALLDRIENQPISRESLSILGRAISSLRMSGTVGLSGVEYVPRDERDSIPVAADVLLRTEGLDTVLVYGIVGTNVEGSLRTLSDKVDPAEFLGRLGKDANGRPFGGGKRNEGGFKIPLGFFSMGAEGGRATEESRADIWRMADRNVKALYLSPEKEAP